jgi:hypothetical protein
VMLETKVADAFDQAEEAERPASEVVVDELGGVRALGGLDHGGGRADNYDGRGPMTNPAPPAASARHGCTRPSIASSSATPLPPTSSMARRMAHPMPPTWARPFAHDVASCLTRGLSGYPRVLVSS